MRWLLARLLHHHAACGPERVQDPTTALAAAAVRDPLTGLLDRQGLRESVHRLAVAGPGGAEPGGTPGGTSVNAGAASGPARGPDGVDALLHRADAAVDEDERVRRSGAGLNVGPSVPMTTA